MFTETHRSRPRPTTQRLSALPAAAVVLLMSSIGAPVDPTMAQTASRQVPSRPDLPAGTPDLSVRPTHDRDTDIGPAPTSSDLDAVNAGLDPAIFGGVPSGIATADALPLSLMDAISRGLQHNLGALLRQHSVEYRRAQHQRARADLLPELSAIVTRSEQEFNFDATAFGRAGGLSGVVDYDFFDARLFVSAPLLDLASLHRARAAAHAESAAQEATRGTRSTIVLLVGNLYLRARVAESRQAAATAQLELARSLLQLARDRFDVGAASRLEPLRAEVQEQSARQRSIVAANEIGKAKLRLARAIGLPLGQDFYLTDHLGYVPARELELAELFDAALEQRPDVLNTRSRVEEARARRRAIARERVPVLALDADYGRVGSKLDDAQSTLSVGASLRLPVIIGGGLSARRRQADAVLQARQDELAALEARVHYQLSEALLDLRAAEAQVEVGRRQVDLARAQLEQARNRFAAGVSDNLDVIAAQEALAHALDLEIDALLAHRLAKGALARGIGLSEANIVQSLEAELNDSEIEHGTAERRR